MKNHEEMTHDVFQRINEYKEAQKKKRRIITRTATSICSLCLIALLGISVWHSGIWNTPRSQWIQIRAMYQAN